MFFPTESTKIELQPTGQKEGDKKMKSKLIAALIVVMLLFIAAGTAALADSAYCNTCNEWTEFTSTGRWRLDANNISNHREIFKCNRCGVTEVLWSPVPHDKITQHEAKAATCTEKGWNAYEVCETCGYSTKKEIDALNHDWGSWTSDGNGQHTRTCGRDGSHTQTEACSGGTATCTEKAVCSVCKSAYGSPLDHDLEHHKAKAATCTEIGWEAYDTCTRCDYTTYDEIDALNHDLVHHEAKAATCTEKGWEAYDTCTRCDYTTYVELPALGHDYQKIIVQPTCEKGGYTRYTCARCEDTYTENPVKKLLHWYAEWSPNGDGTHSADCRREGCKHMGKTDCQRFEFQVEENESLILCPVCGAVKNGERLERIEKALAAAVTGKLPAGEVVVRMNDAYLSIAFEYAGKLTVPAGQENITLPAELTELLEGKTLTLVALDGSETEIPFEIDEEKISFTLDFTDAEIPMMLIRANPEA